MRKNTPYQKTLAVFTLATFLFSDIAWALPEPGVVFARSEAPSFLQIEIPADLASIEELYEAPASQDPSLILHIQNLHGHYESQVKIKKLLDYLYKTYAFKLIFVEGAADALNPDYLKTFPDQERNSKLADYLARQGELTGPELFLMDGPGDVRAVGVEQADIYRANLETFREVYRHKDEIDAFTGGFDAGLDQLSSRLFTREMRDSLAEWRKFESGHREFLPYVKRLAAQSRQILGLDLESLFAQVEWPQVTRLLVLQSMEPELDRPAAEKEKSRLIEFLKQAQVSPQVIEAIGKLGERRITMSKLDAAGQENRLENLPRYLLERLVEEAGPKGFYFHDYPAFSLYAGYLILQNELDSRALFDEISLLFEKILEELARSEKEKNLLELFRDAGLLKKLMQLELNRKEWERVSYRKDWIRPASLSERFQKMAAQHAPEIRMEERNGRGLPKDSFSSALKFYELARQREDVFYQRMSQEMGADRSRKAVLVTGGFHTQGLMDLFRENGVNYGVLMPNLTGRITDAQTQYVGTMLETKPGLFDLATIEWINQMLDIGTMVNMGADEWKRFDVLLQGFRIAGRFKDAETAVKELNMINSLLSLRTRGFKFAAQGRQGPVAIQITRPELKAAIEKTGRLKVRADGILTVLRDGAEKPVHFRLETIKENETTFTQFSEPRAGEEAVALAESDDNILKLRPPADTAAQAVPAGEVPARRAASEVRVGNYAMPADPAIPAKVLADGFVALFGSYFGRRLVNGQEWFDAAISGRMAEILSGFLQDVPKFEMDTQGPEGWYDRANLTVALWKRISGFEISAEEFRRRGLAVDLQLDRMLKFYEVIDNYYGPGGEGAGQSPESLITRLAETLTYIRRLEILTEAAENYNRKLADQEIRVSQTGLVVNLEFVDRQSGEVRSTESVNLTEAKAARRTFETLTRMTDRYERRQEDAAAIASLRRAGANLLSLGPAALEAGRKAQGGLYVSVEFATWLTGRILTYGGLTALMPLLLIESGLRKVSVTDTWTYRFFAFLLFRIAKPITDLLFPFNDRRDIADTATRTPRRSEVRMDSDAQELEPVTLPSDIVDRGGLGDDKTSVKSWSAFLKQPGRWTEGVDFERLLEGRQVLVIGDTNHRFLGVQRGILDQLPALKAAGVTHLALEISSDKSVEDAAKIAQGIYVPHRFVQLVERARALGIEVLFMDMPQSQYPGKRGDEEDVSHARGIYMGQFLAGRIREIEKLDAKARLVAVTGYDHIRKGDQIPQQLADAEIPHRLVGIVSEGQSHYFMGEYMPLAPLTIVAGVASVTERDHRYGYIDLTGTPAPVDGAIHVPRPRLEAPTAAEIEARKPLFIESGQTPEAGTALISRKTGSALVNISDFQIARPVYIAFPEERIGESVHGWAQNNEQKIVEFISQLEGISVGQKTYLAAMLFAYATDPSQYQHNLNGSIAYIGYVPETQTFEFVTVNSFGYGFTYAGDYGGFMFHAEVTLADLQRKFGFQDALVQNLNDLPPIVIAPNPQRPIVAPKIAALILAANKDPERVQIVATLFSEPTIRVYSQKITGSGFVTRIPYIAELDTDDFALSPAEAAIYEAQHILRRDLQSVVSDLMYAQGFGFVPDSKIKIAVTPQSRQRKAVGELLNEVYHLPYQDIGFARSAIYRILTARTQLRLLNREEVAELQGLLNGEVEKAQSAVEGAGQFFQRYPAIAQNIAYPDYEHREKKTGVQTLNEARAHVARLAELRDTLSEQLPRIPAAAQAKVLDAPVDAAQVLPALRAFALPGAVPVVLTDEGENGPLRNSDGRAIQTIMQLVQALVRAGLIAEADVAIDRRKGSITIPDQARNQTVTAIIQGRREGDLPVKVTARVKDIAREFARLRDSVRSEVRGLPPSIQVAGETWKVRAQERIAAGFQRPVRVELLRENGTQAQLDFDLSSGNEAIVSQALGANLGGMYMPPQRVSEQYEGEERALYILAAQAAQIEGRRGLRVLTPHPRTEAMLTDASMGFERQADGSLIKNLTGALNLPALVVTPAAPRAPPAGTLEIDGADAAAKTAALDREWRQSESNPSGWLPSDITLSVIETSNADYLEAVFYRNGQPIIRTVEDELTRQPKEVHAGVRISYDAERGEVTEIESVGISRELNGEMIRGLLYWLQQRGIAAVNLPLIRTFLSVTLSSWSLEGRVGQDNRSRILGSGNLRNIYFDLNPATMDLRSASARSEVRSSKWPDSFNRLPFQVVTIGGRDPISGGRFTQELPVPHDRLDGFAIPAYAFRPERIAKDDPRLELWRQMQESERARLLIAAPAGDIEFVLTYWDGRKWDLVPLGYDEVTDQPIPFVIEPDQALTFKRELREEQIGGLDIDLDPDQTEETSRIAITTTINGMERTLFLPEYMQSDIVSAASQKRVGERDAQGRIQNLRQRPRLGHVTMTRKGFNFHFLDHGSLNGTNLNVRLDEELRSRTRGETQMNLPDDTMSVAEKTGYKLDDSFAMPTDGYAILHPRSASMRMRYPDAFYVAVGDFGKNVELTDYFYLKDGQIYEGKSPLGIVRGETYQSPAGYQMTLLEGDLPGEWFVDVLNTGTRTVYVGRARSEVRANTAQLRSVFGDPRVFRLDGGVRYNVLARLASEIEMDYQDLFGEELEELTRDHFGGDLLADLAVDYTYQNNPKIRGLIYEKMTQQYPILMDIRDASGRRAQDWVLRERADRLRQAWVQRMDRVVDFFESQTPEAQNFIRKLMHFKVVRSFESQAFPQSPFPDVPGEGVRLDLAGGMRFSSFLQSMRPNHTYYNVDLDRIGAVTAHTEAMAYLYERSNASLIKTDLENPAGLLAQNMPLRLVRAKNVFAYARMPSAVWMALADQVVPGGVLRIQTDAYFAPYHEGVIRDFSPVAQQLIDQGWTFQFDLFGQEFHTLDFIKPQAGVVRAHSMSWRAYVLQASFLIQMEQLLDPDDDYYLPGYAPVRRRSEVRAAIPWRETPQGQQLEALLSSIRSWSMGRTREGEVWRVETSAEQVQQFNAVYQELVADPVKSVAALSGLLESGAMTEFVADNNEYPWLAVANLLRIFRLGAQTQNPELAGDILNLTAYLPTRYSDPVIADRMAQIRGEILDPASTAEKDLIDQATEAVKNNQPDEILSILVQASRLSPEFEHRMAVTLLGFVYARMKSRFDQKEILAYAQVYTRIIQIIGQSKVEEQPLYMEQLPQSIAARLNLQARSRRPQPEDYAYADIIMDPLDRFFDYDRRAMTETFAAELSRLAQNAGQVFRTTEEEVVVEALIAFVAEAQGIAGEAEQSQDYARAEEQLNGAIAGLMNLLSPYAPELEIISRQRRDEYPLAAAFFELALGTGRSEVRTGKDGEELSPYDYAVKKNEDERLARQSYWPEIARTIGDLLDSKNFRIEKNQFTFSVKDPEDNRDVVYVLKGVGEEIVIERTHHRKTDRFKTSAQWTVRRSVDADVFSDLAWIAFLLGRYQDVKLSKPERDAAEAGLTEMRRLALEHVRDRSARDDVYYPLIARLMAGGNMNEGREWARWEAELQGVFFRSEIFDLQTAVAFALQHGKISQAEHDDRIARLKDPKFLKAELPGIITEDASRSSRAKSEVRLPQVGLVEMSEQALQIWQARWEAHAKQLQQAAEIIRNLKALPGLAENRERVTRIIYPAAGNDDVTITALLALFPNVREVIPIDSYDAWLRPPVTEADRARQAAEQARLQKQFAGNLERSIRVFSAYSGGQLDAERASKLAVLLQLQNFLDYQAQAARVEGEQTVFIDRFPGYNARMRQDPQFKSRILSLARPGDFIFGMDRGDAPPLAGTQRIADGQSIPFSTDDRDYGRWQISAFTSQDFELRSEVRSQPADELMAAVPIGPKFANLVVPAGGASAPLLIMIDVTQGIGPVAQVLAELSEAVRRRAAQGVEGARAELLRNFPQFQSLLEEPGIVLVASRGLPGPEVRQQIAGLLAMNPYLAVHFIIEGDKAAMSAADQEEVIQIQGVKDFREREISDRFGIVYSPTAAALQQKIPDIISRLSSIVERKVKADGQTIDPLKLQRNSVVLGLRGMVQAKDLPVRIGRLIEGLEELQTYDAEQTIVSVKLAQKGSYAEIDEETKRALDEKDEEELYGILEAGLGAFNRFLTALRETFRAVQKSA